MPKLLILLIIIIAWIISFLYPFFKNFLDEQELDLTYIGLLGLLIFIPFLIKNQNLPKNCPIKIYTIGILVFTPFVAMKFNIINLAVTRWVRNSIKLEEKILRFAQNDE
jgi:hypothetical protein